ncbi:peptidase M50 family protein [Methanocella paludicola SANAE]|uniref:Peptidase M50 family protein n=1 Tax=Methanocella paludicola (strain DSM 17711 / JCM 13418 / NBRC 101707 / SANAE) TaxID=304371 RepID=D1Z110_METPS|nr:site-2 protease family protein [Methanocella paludicola]BAI62382.1 peptidase M50 family protein [Methanocella paludicola SANAE]
MLEPADLEAISKVFLYYEAREEGGIDILYGEPLADPNTIYATLYQHFSKRKKEAVLERRLGETVLVVKNSKAENIWVNVALALATVATTTFTGAILYGVDVFSDPLSIYKGLPFAIAIMAVLGSHELGHYFISKKNGIDATLPYFIPFPIPPIGTMGAIIRQKGPVPSRKALFDVGISGPLVGLVVAIIITIIGLMLPAPTITAEPGDASYFQLQTPILFDLLAGLVRPGVTLESINPIAFAGWVGMLVTMLNMIPVGQLDGGHVARAILGPWSDRLSRIIPLAIVAFGLYTTFIMGAQGQMWIFWGLLTWLMSGSEHPKPLEDTTRIGLPRAVLGVIGFALTVLCFTPFPISM